MSKVSIFWFRRGLRLQDNAGLYHALKGNHPVVPLFIFDREILDELEDKKDARVEFIRDTLKEMRKEYDVIILDTPPIGQTADYNIVKEYLDFTSYVVRYKKTDKESLKQINMLYDTGIVTNIGLIINGVTEAFFNKYGDKGTYYGQYIGREYV